MKAIVMLGVIALISAGYLVKYGRFADEAVGVTPVTINTIRGVAASTRPIAQQLQQDEISAPKMSEVKTPELSAQIEVAKKAILAGEIMPYATPELRDLLRQAYRVDGQMTTPNNPLGCELAEHYYLGYGNGGLDAIKNWKASTKNNVVHISFNSSYDAILIEFTMKANLIDDVRYGYSKNPRKPPTKTTSSLREDAQKMVDTDNCPF